MLCLLVNDQIHEIQKYNQKITLCIPDQMRLHELCIIVFSLCHCQHLYSKHSGLIDSTAVANWVGMFWVRTTKPGGCAANIASPSCNRQEEERPDVYKMFSSKPVRIDKVHLGECQRKGLIPKIEGNGSPLDSGRSESIT